MSEQVNPQTNIEENGAEILLPLEAGLGIDQFEDDSDDLIYSIKLVDPSQPRDIERFDFDEVGEVFGVKYLESKVHIAALKAYEASPDIIARREAELIQNSPEYLRKEIRKISSHPSIVELVEGYPLPDDLKKETKNGRPSEEPLLTTLSEAPYETQARFVEWNKDYVDDLSREKAPLLEKYAAEFAVRVEGAIRDQHLPLTLKQFRGRMADFRMEWADPIAMLSDDCGGYYKDSDKLIRIGIKEDEQSIRKTIYHELLHHLSGQTVREEIHGEFGSLYVVSKTGLRSESVPVMGVWLNEAVTEQLAQILVSEKGQELNFQTLTSKEFFADEFSGGVYRDARSILKHIQGAIPPKTLLAAYFEDYISARSPGRRVPARKTFFTDLENKFGADFMHQFQKLDKSYESKDPQAVKKQLEQMLSSRLMTALLGSGTEKTYRSPKQLEAIEKNKLTLKQLRQELGQKATKQSINQ